LGTHQTMPNAGSCHRAVQHFLWIRNREVEHDYPPKASTQAVVSKRTPSRLAMAKNVSSLLAAWEYTKRRSFDARVCHADGLTRSGLLVFHVRADSAFSVR